MIKIVIEDKGLDPVEQFDIDATITIDDEATTYTCVEAFVHAMKVATYSKEGVLHAMKEYLEEEM